MSLPSPSPEPYRVELAGVVDRELDALEERAFAAGLGQPFSDALDKIYLILQIYPQHGEIRRELKQGEAVYTLRGLAVPPLFVEYIVDESKRRVLITAPFEVMPHSGFE